MRANVYYLHRVAIAQAEARIQCAHVCSRTCREARHDDCMVAGVQATAKRIGGLRDSIPMATASWLHLTVQERKQSAYPAYIQSPEDRWRHAPSTRTGALDACDKCTCELKAGQN
eukprot:4766400-Pleurochrysis_carterae.AAC.1